MPPLVWLTGTGLCTRAGMTICPKIHCLINGGLCYCSMKDNCVSSENRIIFLCGVLEKYTVIIKHQIFCKNYTHIHTPLIKGCELNFYILTLLRNACNEYSSDLCLFTDPSHHLTLIAISVQLLNHLLSWKFLTALLMVCLS